MKRKPIKTLTSKLPNSEGVGGKMWGRTTIKVSGSLRGLLLSSFVLLTGIALTVGNEALAQDAAASCAPAVGRVVALQGNVEVQRAGTANWLNVSRLDTSICAGDRLRTAALSRAALFVQPETLVRVDENTTISLSQTTGEVLVEFHTAEASQTAQNAQSCGAGYFITRFPRKFKVSTPHMNAAVEGTEFMVESSCKASTLTVFEGQVLSQSAATQETRSIAAGQRLETGPASGSVFSTVVRPADAVQWVLHFPQLSDATKEAEIPRASECQALPGSSRVACLTRRADVMLRVGRVDQALEDIDQALALDAGNSDANALRSIIQIAKNNKTAARESANEATTADPLNYRAWLALSYAQQASFKLDHSLDSARKAQGLKPLSSLTHARVAELLLSLGYPDEAEESARAAVAANPNESAAHTILGFVHLAHINTYAARTDFGAAIKHDSFNALPRLGLGLAMIRDGELTKGREQLEIAVALDPANSIFRSYAGKAYYEENSSERDALASTQFTFAEDLDPNDPTPAFYDAILKQSQNRPVEALNRLAASIEKNDNRAVYRSQLLLDDDAAAQGATGAAIYGSLGFEKLSVLESTKALSENAGNHSAHRELATSYANIPRHDIARVSEALQAQIRQPVSVSPVSPLLATDSLLILRDAGPSQLGAQEFNQLFNSNQNELTVEGLMGGRDTFGGQIVMNGLQDTIAYSVSALHYETDGFVENDSAERTVYDLFAQAQVSPRASIQANAKRSELEVGQTFVSFEPLFEDPTIISEVSDSLRLSGRHVASPGTDWIWTAIYEDRRRDIRSFPDSFPLTANDAAIVAVELQNLLRIGSIQIVSGLGYVEENDDFVEGVEVSITAANLYGYGQWRSIEQDLSIQVGFAVDWFELENSFFPNRIEKDRFSPKLGLVWSPRQGTTIRAAVVSTLRRPFVRGQTIEPTQVAGFNQYFTGFERFFGDPDGTVSDRLGIAVDQVLSNSVSAGAELTKRDLEVSQLEGDFQWDESTATLYLYKTLAFDAIKFAAWQGSISIDGEYERIERPAIFTGAEGILELETFRVPLALRLFHNRGWAVKMAATFVKQKGRFSAVPGDPVVPKDDEVFIADLSVEYLLPRRLGSISLGASNLFDKFIDLLEIDPLNPRVATRRFAFAKFRLNF